MPAKRSRIGRSSSFGDTGVMSSPVESPDGITVRPLSNSFKTMNPSVAEKPSEPRSGILTLSSPVKASVDESDKERIGRFLENCYYCKKKIRENAEVFMYSYLCAFCTVECRDKQMEMDNEKERASRKSQGMQLSSIG